MNTPNKLTVIRIILVPFFMFFLLMESIPHRYLIAALLFGIASLTDLYDGKIARERDQITDFGKFADPLADKIMVMAAFMCFIQLGLVGAVAVIIVIIREFMVTSIRLMAVGSGKVIAANNWGKIKTVSQIAAILTIIILQYILELVSMRILPVNLVFKGLTVDNLQIVFYHIGNITVWISVLFTVISGYIYIWDNRNFINTAK